MNPPLPKPAIIVPTGTGTYFDGFTEAQLLAYRAEVIEMCAECMEEQDTQAPKHNAKAIRSLK